MPGSLAGEGRSGGRCICGRGSGTTLRVAIKYQKKAGQWAKGKSLSIHGRMLIGIVSGAALWGIFVGVCFTTLPWALACGVFFVGSCGLWLAQKPVVRRIEAASLSRLKFMRGAQAEGLVAWYLKELPDAWHVFHNLPAARGGDVDHLAVGPGGLFVVSTKSHKGHVTCSPNGMILLNGKASADPDEAFALAMGVLNYLKAEPGLRVPWVQPVLALPMAAVAVPPGEGTVWTIGEEDLLPTLNPERPSDKHRLTREQITAVATVLERLTPMTPTATAG